MTFQTVLQDVLPEKHSLPDSEAYEKINGEYFTVFGAGIKPAAIAQPTSAQEVGALVAKLGKEEGTGGLFAVKGTGCTPFAGTNFFSFFFFFPLSRGFVIWRCLGTLWGFSAFGERGRGGLGWNLRCGTELN